MREAQLFGDLDVGEPGPVIMFEDACYVVVLQIFLERRDPGVLDLLLVIIFWNF